jgi:hypothetical protein
MPSAQMRAFLGFVAAAISVLTFHQGMVALLHEFGLAPFGPYRTTPVPPFGLPTIVSLCFWGGLYGAVFGLALPRFTWPAWLCGLILGVIAALVGLFIVAPLKGLPIAGGWVPIMILRSLVINGFWGIGVGLILPLLMPRALVRVHGLGGAER